MAAQSNTVILGAGIIGVSTAYYLSQSPSTPASSIYLVDSSPRLFASASGYAGGFLARDWFSHATTSLGALSFDLHKELAESHDGRRQWGYSRTTTSSLAQGNAESGRGEDWLLNGGSRAQVAGSHRVEDGAKPSWLSMKQGSSIEVIGSHDSTAQVDPLRLCQFLLNQCQQRGVNVLNPAKALSVSKDLKDELAGIRIAKEDTGEELDLPCTRIIIAGGCWSPQIFSTLFSDGVKLPIGRMAGHSLVVRSPRWTEAMEENGCQAVYTTDDAGFSPEIFGRIGGEIYIAGLNDSNLPLPKIATDAKPFPDAIETLTKVTNDMLGTEGQPSDLEIVREGLCFRPVGPGSNPIVSRLPDQALGAGFKTRAGADGGVYLAAGHGPWGISLSLGTGKCLSQLVEAKEVSADLKALRFRS